MKFTTVNKFFTDANVKDRVFEGYAAKYGNVDHDGDVIEPGAFAKSIKESFPAGKIKVLWQHREPLGMPVAMHEDSQGLFVKAKISKTQLGDEAIELIKDGVIDSMSVGFLIPAGKSDYDAHGVRHIREGILREFSAVTFPANDQAVIMGIKALQDIAVYNQSQALSDSARKEILREIESVMTLLRDMPGAPTIRAKAVSAGDVDKLIRESLGSLLR